MIRGYKPNGYTLSFTREGKRIEAETRQCVHCQFTWTYGDPHFPEELDALLGHPTRRGICMGHGHHSPGWICGRQVCIEEQIHLTGNTTDCITYQDRVERIWDNVAKHFPLEPDLTMTQSGLIVPRSAAQAVKEI